MRRRLAITTLVLVALLPAAAFGQGNAFGPLPQSAPPPVPTPTPAKIATQDSVGRSTLLLIALGVAVVFAGMGMAITRDARGNLTEDDRLALERGTGTPKQTAKQRNAAKAKARQKARAARAARKRTTRNR